MVVKVDEIKNVAVVGAGLMGHGIAQAYAQEGYQVALTDAAKHVLAGVKDRVKSNLDTLSKGELIRRSDVERILDRIAVVDDLEKIARKRGIDVRVMTSHSPTSTYVLEEINMGEGDFAYTDLDDAPCFIISDSAQMLLIMERDQGGEGKPFAMWTNYGTLLKSFQLLFTKIWREPIDATLMAGAPPVT